MWSERMNTKYWNLIDLILAAATLLAAVILLSACAAPAAPATPPPAATPAATPAPAPSATPARPGGDELPPFMPALQKFALDKMNAKPEEIRLIKMEPVDWPDACLGATQPGEICAQVITPGYRLQVEIKGKVVELHSDGGKFIRQPAAAPDSSEIAPAAEAARLRLMDLLKVDSSTIRVVSVVDQDWPDGCLGVYKPDTKCTTLVVPGYRVTLEVRGSTYEIRTSRDGKNIVLADRKYQLSNLAGGGLERPQLTWKSGETNCQLLQAANDQAAFGPCWGTLTVMTLTNPERIKELNALLKTYHWLGGQTSAGEVTFYGGGSGDASPVQQRALAEWAQMVFLEVSSAVALPNNGLALTWKRSGGIAGFCDDLKIYRSGLVTSFNCKSASPAVPATQWLNAAQLEQLYGWMDALQTSDGKQTDSGVADSMSITWVLSGSGTRAATVAERQAIFTFAAALITPK
jgi:hypothetical protein